MLDRFTSLFHYVFKIDDSIRSIKRPKFVVQAAIPQHFAQLITVTETISWRPVSLTQPPRTRDGQSCGSDTQVNSLLWNDYSALQWRHNDHDGVSNHQPHGCLLNRSFGRRSKKTSKLRVTGLCAGNSPGPVNSPHKWPVTRKMFPFDDVIKHLCSAPVLQTIACYIGSRHQGTRLCLLHYIIAINWYRIHW